MHNRRYDLRAFVKHHPGGAQAIGLGRGRNCTELFESYHSLTDVGKVRRTLERYYVGDAREGDPDYDDTFAWDRTPFYDELKRRVRDYFRRAGRSHKAGWEQWAHLLLGCGLLLVAYPLLLRGWWVAVLLAPLGQAIGPEFLLHDGKHFALSKWPWVNFLVSYAGFLHMSPFVWDHQHTIGHHMYTGVVGADPDIYHFTVGNRLFKTGDSYVGVPGFRVGEVQRKPHEPIGTAHSWKLGFAVRMALAAAGPSILEDLLSFLPRQVVWGAGGVGEHGAFLGVVPFSKISRARRAAHLVGRALVMLLCVWWPFASVLLWGSGGLHPLLRLAKAATFATAPWMLYGCIYYLQTQASHLQEEHFEAVGEAEGYPTIKKEWAAHQVEHTQDYCTTSALWAHLVGGLNNQIVHHLFPHIAWQHYRHLAPIVEATCAEFGVNYIKHPTFAAAFGKHLRYIWKVNVSQTVTVPPQRKTTVDGLVFLGEVPWGRKAKREWEALYSRRASTKTD